MTKNYHHCPLYLYLKVLPLRCPVERISPEFHLYCVCLPESFTDALMKTAAFFFGVTRQEVDFTLLQSSAPTIVIFPQILHMNILTSGANTII